MNCKCCGKEPTITSNAALIAESEMLDALQRGAFSYFAQFCHPETGLISDSTRPQSPASIAAVGMGLASYIVAAERGFVTRLDALEKCLQVLRFLSELPQGDTKESSGYRGFFYHFLDGKTGKRAWTSELSTIDTALLIAGALSAAAYFDRDSVSESKLRQLVNALYQRVEWEWALDGGRTLTHGWTPESGFIEYRWEGYDEALILYALALGSESFAIPPDSYQAWTETFAWKSIYGHELLYSGPLFVHQFSHLWIDFRGIQDAFMQEKHSDYFQNSRRATLIHQEYSRQNPLKFDGYCECAWGLTASDGPGPRTATIDGIERTFFDYVARGVPYGPDDGTIAPWVAIASLPFAPEIVLPTIAHFTQLGVATCTPFGFESSFNRTFVDGTGKKGWASPWSYGLSQGPVVLMVENYRSGLIWNLFKRTSCISVALKEAGFRGGWLS